MITHKLLTFTTLCLLIGFALLPGAGYASNSGAPQTGSGTTTPSQPQVAPLYGSDTDIGRVQSSAYNTPESDGRPGQYFFDLGAQAVKQKDYAHAIAMYKVAASWAYKPAEYNLAVMYLNGQGTPVDLPRALAWMALAAERNDPQYVKARNLINGHLNDAQFKQANVILAELSPTYGDKVALARAETRWREVRAGVTGSRVGSAAGHVQVGAVAGVSNTMQSPNYDVGGSHSAADGAHMSASGAEVAGVHQTDGALAYQQLRASNNPYDPKFKWRPGLTGTVTVDPLIPVKKSDAEKPAASGDASSTDNSNH
ncbi:tetratricopeptide repeat protein [Rhodanobacter umsongensis]